MLRWLLSHLLVLPLLLPQGVCVCDLLKPGCEACTEGVSSGKPGESADCGCCKHKNTAPASGETLARAHTCTRSAPDNEDRHLPGCPIKTGGAQWKSEPAPSPVLDNLAFAGLMPVAHSTATGVAALPSQPVDVDGSDQPLYLTLLTLRL